MLIAARKMSEGLLPLLAAVQIFFKQTENEIPVSLKRGGISMKKRRNLLLVLALFLILALGLTACGEKKSDPTTVTIWHVYGGEVT